MSFIKMPFQLFTDDAKVPCVDDLRMPGRSRQLLPGGNDPHVEHSDLARHVGHVPRAGIGAGFDGGLRNTVRSIHLRHVRFG